MAPDMTEANHPVLAIFGPTGSGKSAVAEAVADRIPAEIVSADSMQVYRGLPILTNQDAFTLQLGLATFQGAHNTQWHLVSAANIMSMLPILALFLVAQRSFVRGIATQGLKG